MNEVELLALCDIFKRHGILNDAFVIAKDELHTIKNIYYHLLSFKIHLLDEEKDKNIG